MMKLATSVAYSLLLAGVLFSADTLAFSRLGGSTAPLARLPSSSSVQVGSWQTKQFNGPACPRKIRTQVPASSSFSLAAAASSSGGILSNETTQKVASTSLLIVMDVAIRRLFKRYAIAFPSSLAGCGFLFATLLSVNAIKPEWGDSAYNVLSPGAAVLAKWLPVFFVPSLVTLPLAQSLGNGVELAKVAAVIVGGFFFTLFTTAGSVLAVRKLQGSTGSVSQSSVEEVTQEKQTPSPSPPAKAFSDSTSIGLAALAATSGALAVVATRAGSSIANPLQSAYMLFTTLASFVFGARLPKKFTKIVHPLVTCTSLTWLGAKLLALATGGTFLSILQSYKAATLAPMLAGAGDVLLFMLGPAVVALACQMYDRKKLMRENILEVGTSVGVSAFGGLFGTAAMVRLLGIANPTIRLCLLSRNITSPLAMAIASILGADVSLAVSMVVITGLIGANFGASILDAAGINDAVARGLGIGAAAHGLGTAAFANEKDAFPFAAIGMALTGALTTVLVSLPALKKAVLSLALGV
mmetsp:Transcript_11520/g.25826  ORF Transcript_11520/g.25826 Transcript_11520/m.25826 type:complete len:526 (-) Transcript_11520:57-1634(-)